MAEHYNANDRYRGGSFEARLNPKCVNPELNAKLGPRMPSRDGLLGGVKEPGVTRRRAVIGLPPRFDNKG